MAKIHTHYDNLKVARLAPQEVIRAAYKALSQKYHPDKNPGDEKAARIMAILNTAYGILGDPARRKEHDEWIAAEEWEIEWLESTRSDDAHKAREAAPAHAWEPRPVGAPAPYRVARDPKWYLAMLACFAAGGAAALLILEQPKLLPVALATVLNGAAAPRAAAPAEPVPVPEPAIDSWAVSKAYVAAGAAPPPDVRTLGVTQLLVPAGAPDCASALHTLVAPNGEAWPAATGYIDGYPLGNPGEQMQITVDNANNASAVFVKLYDLDRRANVRHAYVLAHESLAIDKLAAGKYEVRYQNVDLGAAKGDCGAPAKAPARLPDAP
ncbi:MAG: J domain-containing protein [Pseudomonadota bacterium]|nr:J domain-containing protein [Pseudomonadota bacterium]